MPRISRVRRATTVASTFAIALGIGFVMQNGDASAARYASDQDKVVRKPVMIIDYSPLREMTEFRLKPEPVENRRASDLHIDPDSVKLVALVEDIAAADTSTLFAQARQQQSTQSDCDVNVATAPSDTGAVIMSLVSSCRVDMPFAVNHNGLTFSAQTDHQGKAFLTIPAMAVDATFFISFEDGKSFATSTVVSSAANFNRVVFQWEGHPGAYIQLSDSPTSQARIDRLGTDVGEIPRFVDVYSFPAGTNLTDGLNGIDLLAEVTESNCDQDLVAESFSVFPGLADLAFKDIRITLPDCHSIGDTIGLKKVLGEQTLAAK